MVLDTHPHPAQLSLTTVRTLPRLTTLSPSCIQCAISLSIATELFPFAPLAPFQRLTQFDFSDATRQTSICGMEATDHVTNLPKQHASSILQVQALGFKSTPVEVSLNAQKPDKSVSRARMPGNGS